MPASLLSAFLEKEREKTGEGWRGERAATKQVVPCDGFSLASFHDGSFYVSKKVITLGSTRIRDDPSFIKKDKQLVRPGQTGILMKTKLFLETFPTRKPN